MAQVLNARERNQAFWKFIAFFLLAVLMVVGAVYFDTRIPHKDNEMLREEVGRYRTQAQAQEKFVKNMDDAKIMIDSLKKPGTNLVYLNQQIAAKIRELSDLQYKDSSMYARLNKDVIDVFLRYQEAVNHVVAMGNVPQELNEYKTKYAETQRDLQNALRDLDMCRRTNNAATDF